MFRNYLLVSIRNYFRNKSFSIINTLGLSIGVSAALVIFLIVQFEFSYDKFEKDPERIFRVVMEINDKGNLNHSAAIPAPLAEAAQRELTGIDKVVPRFQFQGDGTVKVSLETADPKRPMVFKHQPEVIFTNTDYFSVVPFKWLAGSPTTAMQEPFSVVLTESRANLYFPGISPQNVIGRIVTYGDTLKATVHGVVADLDEKTFFTSLEFISMPTIMQSGLKNNFLMDTWDDWMAYSQAFIKIAASGSRTKTEGDLNALLAKYLPKKNPDFKIAFRLQPLKEIHFNYESFGQRTANKKVLYGLLAIAGFLLFLGCINFINLTTAQAVRRSKEIGIRKTMGGSRFQLITQFLGETFIITATATLVSIALTPLLLDVFNDFTPPGLKFSLSEQPYTILFLLGITFFVSLLAGIYPALFLSSYKPVLVLKNQGFGGQGRHVWVRRTLTLSQFVIAQFFVIATLGVSKQIHFTLNKDLGFKKEAIINFEIPRAKGSGNEDRGRILMQKIAAIPEIQMASSGFLPPAAEGPAYTNVKFNDGKEDVKADVQIRWGDTNYLKLYHIGLIAGREPLMGDTMKEYLVNETYARLMGFQNPADAIGKQLNINGKLKPIVGVMKDFHEQSLHLAIDPLIYSNVATRNSIMHVALRPQAGSPSSWQQAIQKLEVAYKNVYPDSDFSYSFLDESIARLYTLEQNTVKLLSWATGLTILISCLGLLGLVIYTTNTRTKEIGIRKVLGATVFQIVTNLSRGFLRPVVVAFLIAAPLGWWALNSWLDDFAFRTPMSWWLFALSGVSMLIVTVLTLSVQTVRSAMANPVSSLRSE